MNRLYIGDGVYAFYDGYYIWLRADAPVNENHPSDEGIALEPGVMENLNSFCDRYWKSKDE